MILQAPFTGIVTEVHIEVGEWIRMGEPVVRLADFDTVEIRLDVPERYFPQLRRGAPAPAKLAAGGCSTYLQKLAAAANTYDSSCKFRKLPDGFY